MTTTEEVLQLLVDLGADKQEVVNKLMALGIKGDRKKCKTCPIARYLIRNGVEGGVVVAVGVGVELAFGYYWFPLHNYPQVKPVYNFIWSFDAGKYPQLESESCDG